MFADVIENLEKHAQQLVEQKQALIAKSVELCKMVQPYENGEFVEEPIEIYEQIDDVESAIDALQNQQFDTQKILCMFRHVAQRNVTAAQPAELVSIICWHM